MKNKKEEKYLTLYLDEYGDFEVKSRKKIPDLNEYICGNGLRELFNVSTEAKKIYISVSETKKAGYASLVYSGGLRGFCLPDQSTVYLTSSMLKVFIKTFELTLPSRGYKTFYVDCWQEV